MANYSTFGELQLSSYAKPSDRLWLKINGGRLTVKRGWSPSPANPLVSLGAMPETTRLEILKHLDAITVLVLDAYNS